MDIRLFVHGPTRLGPNLLAEVQERMGNRRGNGSERQAIVKRESGREEQGRKVACLFPQNRTKTYLNGCSVCVCARSARKSYSVLHHYISVAVVRYTML